MMDNLTKTSSFIYYIKYYYHKVHEVHKNDYYKHLL